MILEYRVGQRMVVSAWCLMPTPFLSYYSCFFFFFFKLQQPVSDESKSLLRVANNFFVCVTTSSTHPVKQKLGKLFGGAYKRIVFPPFLHDMGTFCLFQDPIAYCTNISISNFFFSFLVGRVQYQSLPWYRKPDPSWIYPWLALWLSIEFVRIADWEE